MAVRLALLAFILGLSLELAFADCAKWVICNYSAVSGRQELLYNLDPQADDIHALGYYYNRIDVAAVAGKGPDVTYRAISCVEGATPIPLALQVIFAKAGCGEVTQATAETFLQLTPNTTAYSPIFRTFVEGATSPFDSEWILRNFSDPATTNVFGP